MNVRRVDTRLMGEPVYRGMGRWSAPEQRMPGYKLARLLAVKSLLTELRELAMHDERIRYDKVIGRVQMEISLISDPESLNADSSFQQADSSH